MDKNLKNVIMRLVEEVMAEAPAPTIEPPTKPSAPPTPTKPTTRPNPLRPTRPGIAPRPKALSHDVEAFLNQRKGLTEKIDTGEDIPDLIDPSKRAKIEDEKDYVEQILPDLGPEADRYLEIITSESYMAMLAIKALNDVKRAESGMKQQLEKIAVDVVLDLQEYDIIKGLVEDGSIIIDAKLGNADLTKAVTTDKMDEEMPNGLTVAENLNIQVNTMLGDKTEGKLRRTLANYMTQGDATNKMFLFNLVSDKLDALSPNLSKKYGVLAAITQIGYYMTPDFPITSDIVNMAAVGSEQVIPTGDKYTIKVRAMTFPYLVHELVKGFGDYLSMDIASQEELDTETLDDETKQIMAGPALEMQLRSLVPKEKIEYLPLIKKLFYKLPIETIKEILAGGMKAKYHMDNLIDTAEKGSENVD